MGQPLTRIIASMSCAALAGAVALAQAPPRSPLPAQTRTQAPREQAPQVPATASISGIVVVADSGQPLDGVRVSLSGANQRGSRSTYTDDDGRFAFVGLQAGTVTLSGSKAGYVSVTYGQTRPGPGQSGTPIALQAGQQMKDVTLRIPRGGVITGVVVDERGRPVVNAPVRVSRWTFDEGERSLDSAGSATTDDRGRYRIYGLAPGTYVAHTAPRSTFTITADITSALEMFQGERVERVQILATAVSELRDQRFVAAEAPDTVTTGFAEVYFPGATDVAAAAPITIGPGEERSGIDLRLTKVKMAPVTGQVMLPPGANLSNFQVRLTRADSGTANVGGSSNTTRAGRDGSFRFANVAPGRYRVFVSASERRNDDDDDDDDDDEGGRGAQPAAAQPRPQPQRFWGTTEVMVDGTPVTGVTVSLQPGLGMAGRVMFNGRGTPPENLRRVRVSLSPTQQARSNGASQVSANVGTDGQFHLSGVVPGQYEVRVSGASGWFAESAMTGGRDALDFLLDVTPQSGGTTMLVTLGDQRASLAGTLVNQLSQPSADYTIVLFAADPGYWVPRSRRIRATRPSTDGRFSFGDIPPGSYRLAAVTGMEPDAWFDPEVLKQLAGASVPVMIAKGEAKTQDIRVAGR